MSDMTAALAQLYVLLLLVVFIIVFGVYLEIDGKKNQNPIATSDVKDVKHERRVGDKTEYRGSSEALPRRSSGKRRGRNSRSVVRSGRRSPMGVRSRNASLHRRHGC